MDTDKNIEESGYVIGEGLVMVVDDESIMRKIAINVLQNSGYQVIAVESGEEAVDIFKTRHHEIKLVLLDLLMPIQCGKDTYFKMKAIDPDVKVLLISGAKKDVRIDQLLNSGVIAYIEKPYTFEHLSKMVHKAIYKN
jgi:DNA-binding NtrC family response regulator